MAGASLLAIDLDRFKVVNDSLGHEKGDRILAAAAQRLRSLAPCGSLVARLGGDEFAILLDGQSDPIRTAQLVLDDFAAPFVIDAREVFSPRASASPTCVAITRLRST